jgi:hypothetical protein
MYKSSPGPRGEAGPGPQPGGDGAASGEKKKDEDVIDAEYEVKKD